MEIVTTGKKYTIRKIGVHDGYYKADPSLAKKMIGMEVIPVVENGRTLLHYRDEDETKIVRKGQEPIVLFVEGTYYGEFSIPELHVVRTRLSEVYLTVIDATTGKAEDSLDETKKDAVEAIEKELERLAALLEDVKHGKPSKHTSIAEVAATLIAADDKGTLVVEDDSKLPKNAIKPGFYQTDEDGNPDPSKPGEEPAFAPVAEEAKQEKFDRAEAVAEEKRLEKLAVVAKKKNGKGGRK
jgi:hypothetical protein